MWKKFNVTVLAVLAFGFASALRLNAGTEVVEPYRAPAPTYNYAPPVYYAPPAVGGFLRAAVRGFRCPPIPWATRSLAFSSLAVTDSTEDSQSSSRLISPFYAVLVFPSLQRCGQASRPPAFASPG